MLIKLFSYDTIDALYPCFGDDYSVNMFRLPRGYELRADEHGRPFILCPNGERVYEFDQVRSRSETAKFSYIVNGKKRTVRLHIDEDATHQLLSSGEDFRSFP